MSRWKLKVTHPEYVLMSSDYGQQEPRLSAFISGDSKMIATFRDGKDIYATLASVGLGFPYEDCLEFVLDENGKKTDQVNPEGKERRATGKVLVLGINYGMSVPSISDMLFGDRDDMTDDQKLAEAQKIQDKLVKGLPELQRCILDSQLLAAKTGYTETILGRRRHHPDMQLPRYDFVPMKGYMNPDVDPLDPETMKNKDQIPQRIVEALKKEFAGYKYYGMIVKRTKELAEQKIKVVNNSRKIDAAKREIFNSKVQGSAADMTKMAMLRLEADVQWKKLHGKFVNPVHDELLAEIPLIYREQGAATLSRCMEEAGSFLPFPISCDVETTFRWYGLPVEDILSFEKPLTLDKDSQTDSSIKWIQSMLAENEYLLPKFNTPDGKKPQGIAAQGVNGVWTEDMEKAIADYKQRYRLVTDEEFIDHIERKVCKGVI